MGTPHGFIAGHNGEFLDYEPSDEEMAFTNALFGSADGILFGRRTYEGFVSYWDALDPSDETIGRADIEFAGILIKGNIAPEVSKLKQQPGRDLLLICGPELLSTLVELELVDKFLLLVRPLVLGRGKAIFGDIPKELRLRLVSSSVFESGVVMHHYEPA